MKNVSLFLLLMLMASASYMTLYSYLSEKELPKVSWHVLDVSDSAAQADSNLIQFSNGMTVLIDAGQRTNKLLPRLRSRGIQKIDKIFISHAHKDHYDAIPSLLEDGIAIGEVYFNMPPKLACDAEIPWGCDWSDLEKLTKRLASAKVTLKPLRAGETFIKYDEIELSALYVHDAVSPPVGPTDINDMSAIMSLRNNEIKALFTGDLNMKYGSYLADLHDSRLKAHLLKVPHHGTESLAPDSFFEWVNPAAAFVPAPLAIWQSDRSRRPRSWFQSRQVPTYVTGEVGAVMIDILPAKYTINSSK